MQRADSLEKIPVLGKIEGRTRRGQRRMRRLVGFTDTMDMNLGKLQEMLRAGRPGVLQSMGSRRVGHDLVIEQQQHKCLFLYMRVLVLKSGSRQVYTIGGSVQVQSLTSIHKFFQLGHAPCYVKDIRKPHFDL